MAAHRALRVLRREQGKRSLWGRHAGRRQLLPCHCWVQTGSGARRQVCLAALPYDTQPRPLRGRADRRDARHLPSTNTPSRCAPASPQDERARKYAQEVQSLQFNVLVTTYEFIMRDRTRLSKARGPLRLLSRRSGPSSPMPRLDQGCCSSQALRAPLPPRPAPALPASPRQLQHRRWSLPPPPPPSPQFPPFPADRLAVHHHRRGAAHEGPPVQAGT